MSDIAKWSRVYGEANKWKTNDIKKLNKPYPDVLFDGVSSSM